MDSAPPPRPGRPADELANALTHGLGVLASVAAVPVLVVLAARAGDVWDVVGASIFGTTLVILYLASTAYHAARRPALKARLKVLDHCAIYLLIAGSYTPFLLGPMRGGWGWSLFGVIWGLAATGVVLKTFLTGRYRLLSTLTYVGMGWLVLIAVVPLLRSVSPAVLTWLVAGGIAYTAGTPFYQTHRHRFTHAVWHGFVLAGSACHVVAVALATLA
jgi:hemolysin III